VPPVKATGGLTFEIVRAYVHERFDRLRLCPADGQSLDVYLYERGNVER